jgi:tRNA A37 methylthiotransferase MiaB
MRGKHRSTPIEDLVTEAEKLAAKGTKELILIAQDLTYYGLILQRAQIGRFAACPCKSGGYRMDPPALLVPIWIP